MLIVQKFGGSSLADSTRMRRAAEIILAARQKGNKILAVVSAPGDTTDELSSNAKKLVPNPDLRELDALLATGEQQSAACLAMLLRSMGVSAISLTGWQAGIFTSSQHGNADIKKIFPEKIQSALAKGQIVIISGFQGVTSLGDISTLGRGGSDTSAAALAAALKADECRIYTDVDGIFSADPRLIEDAKFLSEVDYRDMLALSACGAQVLKEQSVRLAMDNKLKLRLLSSFTDSAGSALSFLPDEIRPDYMAVTRDEGSSTVSAVGKAVSPDTLSLVLNSFKSAGIKISFGGIRENVLSVKVAREQLIPAMKLLHSLLIN